MRMLPGKSGRLQWDEQEWNYVISTCKKARERQRTKRMVNKQALEGIGAGAFQQTKKREDAASCRSRFFECILYTEKFKYLMNFLKIKR